MKLPISVFALALVLAACNNEITGLEPPSDPATETFAPQLGVDISQMRRLPGGTYIRDVVVGTTGDSVKVETDTVWITYAGFLKDGKLFDSGTNRKFVPTDLVPGLRAALIDMRPGGRRKVVIPSAQGYGRHSRRGEDGKILIPRQSTLVFDVELLRLHNRVTTPPST